MQETKNDLAILIPSRGRPQNIEDLLFSCRETGFNFDKNKIYVIIDDDDEMINDYHQAAGRDASVIVYKREGKGMAKPLNKAVKEYGAYSNNLMFMGDDHRPRTDFWDQRIIDALGELKTGLVYPNDMFQGKNLATCVAMTSSVAEAMGWAMVPPNMIHLYLDNFWMRLGNDIRALKYLEDVVVEHLHPIAGKAQWDEGYKEVNAQEVYSADEKAFSAYIQSEEYQKLVKVLS